MIMILEDDSSSNEEDIMEEDMVLHNPSSYTGSQYLIISNYI